MSGDASEQLIQALQNPAVYDHPADEIRFLETHISWVLLAGDFAYKLKKPVNLGFVDFTTLAKRKLCCEEELRLNGRLAPDLYLEVVPITGTPSNPRLRGDADPIEYAVRMKRFPQEALLSHAMEQGTMQPGHVDSLIEVVAAFHGRIEVASAKSPFGSPQRILEPVEENFRHLFAFLDEEERRGVEADIESLRKQVHKLQEWSEREFSSRKEVIGSRKRDGFVRDCHGDMHLGNMVLNDGNVTIFDCIEFNESFRWIDVLSEVAFVAMDLEDRGRPDFAHRFLNGWLERTGDYAGLCLLPFYLTYRALVRAKVASLRLSQQGPSAEERKELHKEFYSYLELAERYTKPPHPLLMITHGVSGTGKTTGTQPLVERVGAVRIRSDVERKRLYGLSPLEKSGSGIAQDLYSSEANLKTYRRLQELVETILRAGYSVIVDAAFLRQSDREQFREISGQLNVPFLLLDFQASEETLKQRVSQREKTGRDASEAGSAVLERQLEIREPLSKEENSFSIAIDTESPDDTNHLIAEIEKQRSKERLES